MDHHGTMTARKGLLIIAATVAFYICFVFWLWNTARAEDAPKPVQWEVTVTVTIDGREVDVRHYGTGGHAMRFPSYEACTEFRKTDPVYLESLGNLADFIDAIAVKHPTVSGKVACVVVGEDV